MENGKSKSPLASRRPDTSDPKRSGRLASQRTPLAPVSMARLAAPASRVLVEQWMRQFQDWVCYRLQEADGSGRQFSQKTRSVKERGGEDFIQIFANGHIIEKGAVVYSAGWTELPEATAFKLGIPDQHYFSTSVVVGIHPASPWIPASYLKLYYYEARSGERWFGGGLDLSPAYVDVPQAHWYHAQLREVCRRTDPQYYQRFKEAADAHFLLPHRAEMRGIGGLYFDRLVVDEDGLFEELFAFVQDIGEAYCRLYTTIMRQNAHRSYGEREKHWQQVRRGRFAEFAMAVDGGTLGEWLAGADVETVLVSLPPEAAWLYGHTPEPGSPEAAALPWFQPGTNWLRGA